MEIKDRHFSYVEIAIYCNIAFKETQHKLEITDLHLIFARCAVGLLQRRKNVLTKITDMFLN